MEDIHVVIIDWKNVENPFGEYSGNLTSQLIRHPDLISKEAKFVQVELQVYDELGTPYYRKVDLVLEDENNIYLVEVKDDPSEVEEGKSQILRYVQVFKVFLKIKGITLTKRIVPIVATMSLES